MPSDKGAVIAIVPTYNEPEDLRRVVESLLVQGTEGLHILVVNAGRPLPEDIASLVEEVRVGEDQYWTHCVAKGFELARQRDFPFVYLTNADTYALPGTLPALIGHVRHNPSVVACSPAYIESEGQVRLLYSHQDPMGILLYGRLIRPWVSPSEAPSDPYPIRLTGGQGVLAPMEVVRKFDVDVQNFPHYASDHDLWLQVEKAGWRLDLVPGAGVVNTRILSAQHVEGLGRKLSKLWTRMSSDMTPESLRIMWRLRKKHLPWPLAVVSTLVSFGLRWTIGLPKILRRT